MREHRTYRPGDEPDVEVLVDGAWWRGELRQWTPVGDAGWSALVTWHRGAGETRLDRFAAADVQPASSPTPESDR